VGFQTILNNDNANILFLNLAEGGGWGGLLIKIRIYLSKNIGCSILVVGSKL
jgi:hypothetical protein